jgi:hypothetical protein
MKAGKVASTHDEPRSRTDVCPKNGGDACLFSMQPHNNIMLQHALGRLYAMRKMDTHHVFHPQSNLNNRSSGYRQLHTIGCQATVQAIDAFSR